MLKKSLAIGLSLLLASQSLISGSYAIDQVSKKHCNRRNYCGNPEDSNDEYGSNEDPCSVLWSGLFHKSVDENLADNQTKEKIHKNVNRAE